MMDREIQESGHWLLWVTAGRSAIKDKKKGKAEDQQKKWEVEDVKKGLEIKKKKDDRKKFILSIVNAIVNNPLTNVASTILQGAIDIVGLEGILGDNGIVSNFISNMFQDQPKIEITTVSDGIYYSPRMHDWINVPQGSSMQHPIPSIQAQQQYGKDHTDRISMEIVNYSDYYGIWGENQEHYERFAVGVDATSSTVSVAASSISMRIAYLRGSNKGMLRYGQLTAAHLSLALMKWTACGTGQKPIDIPHITEAELALTIPAKLKWDVEDYIFAGVTYGGVTMTKIVYNNTHYYYRFSQEMRRKLLGKKKVMK